MKTITELAAEARRTNAQMGDGFDYAIHTTVHSIIAIESEVTALRERLAAAEADAERLYEALGLMLDRFGEDGEEEPYTTIGRARKAYAARNPTKEG